MGPGLCFNIKTIFHVDGLVQERRNSIANALELCLSCINTSILSIWGESLYSKDGIFILRLPLNFQMNGMWLNCLNFQFDPTEYPHRHDICHMKQYSLSCHLF